MAITIREIIGNDAADVMRDFVTDWPHVKGKILTALPLLPAADQARVSQSVNKAELAFNFLKNVDFS